jgi:hypothetical protein
MPSRHGRGGSTLPRTLSLVAPSFVLYRETGLASPTPAAPSTGTPRALAGAPRPESVGACARGEHLPSRSRGNVLGSDRRAHDSHHARNEPPPAREAVGRTRLIGASWGESGYPNPSRPAAPRTRRTPGRPSHAMPGGPEASTVGPTPPPSSDLSTPALTGVLVTPGMRAAGKYPRRGRAARRLSGSRFAAPGRGSRARPSRGEIRASARASSRTATARGTAPGRPAAGSGSTASSSRVARRPLTRSR